ncbi:YdcH family protein [Pseudoblastomonas halimionae]|uniref:DUF465 domain-containing protein n=1 Tax=Alteriqipengyuania halimionae TaxID=1926630 RepID=A0A6I4U6N2_9SPHN|nr:YdcH family protein [Alteriqipengyuania halimionae]MXP10485.1 DUF465 domain-containing protein [Alteriqipengyuania halimionae]
MDTSHASALQAKHARVEARLREEQSRPMPDDAVIHDLKRKKLALKDELTRH